MSKYTIQKVPKLLVSSPTEYFLRKDGITVATFHNYGKEIAAVNAQRVCDILNELSRSQGKYK